MKKILGHGFKVRFFDEFFFFIIVQIYYRHLRASNKEGTVAALAKVQGCRDFILPRKRGHPRKDKGRYED